MAQSAWWRVLFPGQTPEPREAPRVLAITASTSDMMFYVRLHLMGNWQIVLRESVSEALALLLVEPFPIVVYDRELPDWGWREVLERVVVSSPHSCFLLASRVSDEYLWREVVSHGGYDVIAKPLEDSAVNQALQRAWYFWQAEHR